MDVAQRKRYSAEFKAQVTLEALKGQKTVNELASTYGCIRPRSPIGNIGSTRRGLTVYRHDVLSVRTNLKPYKPRCINKSGNPR